MSDAAVAFGAGLVSFGTPCVLPLVPAYLSAIGIAPGDTRTSLLRALPFVLGFSLVFVVLGILAGLAGGQLADHRDQLAKLSGIVIVAMGFAMLGLLPLPLLNRTAMPALEPARRTGSPLLLGGAFALCFTPCVTPVLASLLVLSAGVGTAARAAGLLAAYAAGLALPFLLAAVALGRTMGVFRVVRDRYTVVRAVSGVVLVVAGLLVFFDQTFLLNGWVNDVTDGL
ncbi:MAG: cytochrome c-type biosis protein [Gaiellales bacterium]|jgi:cytochrome c-type biogenesis protein|nr:cytochrome c-type biosis protein [Gaiellales bacterium]